MDKNDAKNLIRRLIDAAYEAGMYHNSTMRENWQKRVIKIGDKISRHLLSKSSRGDNARCVCPKCGQPHDPKLIDGGQGQLSGS